MSKNFQPLYFDTHCHLFFSHFQSDVQAIIDRCYQKGIMMLVAGIDLETSKLARKLANDYENVYFAAGLHPTECDGMQVNVRSYLAEFFTPPLHPKLVAVGETGLDHHWHPEWDEPMVQNFIQHIELAQLFDLPLIIHSRGNDQRTAEILDSNAQNSRGVLHCFNGSSHLYTIGKELSYYFSFAGNITYPKAQNLRDWVLTIPADKICIETDAPYLAPQAFRGKRNEPSYLVNIADFITSLRSDLNFNMLVDNGLKLFKLGD